MSRLERLLRPKSIAVIGGGAFGTNVVKQCLKMGFAGDIWPVHPKRDEVGTPRFAKNAVRHAAGHHQKIRLTERPSTKAPVYCACGPDCKGW